MTKIEQFFNNHDENKRKHFFETYDVAALRKTNTLHNGKNAQLIEDDTCYTILYHNTPEVVKNCKNLSANQFQTKVSEILNDMDLYLEVQFMPEIKVDDYENLIKSIKGLKHYAKDVDNRYYIQIDPKTAQNIHNESFNLIESDMAYLMVLYLPVLDL